MKKSMKSILVLVVICATVAILLAFTNSITAPIIKENEQKKSNAALLEVMPDGISFESIDTNDYVLPSTVSAVYSAESGGYVIKLTTTGYSSGMVIMCGISADGTVTGTKLITSSETPAIGGVAAEAFAGAVVGKTTNDIDTVDTISGATKTTAAYRAAVKDALNAAIILGGGSVDLRTEEEILNDNLSAALPAAEGGFQKYFFVEVIENIDAIYTATNGKGAVCIIGEQFVGIDENGTVITECSDDDANAVKDAIAVINATELTDIDISAYTDLPSQIISAKKTATGNYVIDIKAQGYSMQNSYAPADQRKPIEIRVSITAAGVIIDCLTLSQNETAGIGSTCADEKFYGQFDGKTEENYGDIDAITGATVTTNGYTKAIQRAFECVKIFEKG